MAYQYSLVTFISGIFYFLVFLNAMGAYSLAGVPIPWMANAGMAALFGWLIIRRRVPVFPGGTFFIGLFFWALAVTLSGTLFGSYGSLMPARATTSYSVFVGLRFFTIVVFLSTAMVTYWILHYGGQKKLVRAITNIGVVISLLGLYIYLAQIFGLPELPRTRVGTSGEAQEIHFSYAFHRALGTFREPSHLAEWLVVPLFLSYVESKKIINIKALIISTTLLLTGSLTGIVSSGLGLLLSSLMVHGVEIRERLRGLRFFMPLLVGGGIFSLLAVASKGGSIQLVSVLWDRIEPILFEKGVESTNRYYVYDFVRDNPFPLLGHGMGNANLEFVHYLGIQATPSFLSLYIKYLYSVGILGFALLIVFLMLPLLLHFFYNKGKNNSEFVFILAGYLAWLFVFAMHSEDLSLFFGVIYSLVCYSIVQYRRRSLVVPSQVDWAA